MKKLKLNFAACLGIGMSLFITACGGGGGGSATTPPPTTYVLTVSSTNPASGVAITVSPADNNGSSNGTATFTRTYNAGTSVKLTSPATVGTGAFVSWTGCTSATTVTCNVTMNANAAVTATYNGPTISSISVTPNTAI